MNRKNRKAYFEKELLQFTPRLLSSLDRCPVSSSRGSFDREYWAWATKDFANIDLQRGLLVLGHLYKTKFDGNIYYQQKSIIPWIESGINFWIGQQNRAGSFDHLYLNEGSWMATAFTIADFIPLYKLLGNEISIKTKNTWLESMKRGGHFLIKYNEEHGFISNHRAGAACALLGLYHLTSIQTFRNRAFEIIKNIYQEQSKEGWYKEYEGADPGYQTLDVHYQAKLLEYSDDQTQGMILSSVGKSLEYLSYFVGPDGSLGGEYGSRNCPHYFPGGFEVFSNKFPLSEAIAGHCVRGLANIASCGLHDADIRNAIPMATSYVLAHSALLNDVQNEVLKLPYEIITQKIFPESGMFISSSSVRYIIFGASKGGVIKIYDKESQNLLYSSCGYVAECQSKLYTNLHWTSNPEIKLHDLGSGKMQIEVSAPFYRFHADRTMSPIYFLFFRLFNLTIGRFRLVNNFVRKHLIVGRFINARKRLPLTLTRTMILNDQNIIEIRDKIIKEISQDIQGLREYGFLSTIYMASARYFRKQDFFSCWSGNDLANEINRRNFIELSKII
jgi:hypothetical protein